MSVPVADVVEVAELPDGRLGTPHVTVRRTVNPAELEQIAAEYSALAAYLRVMVPDDAAEVAAIAEAVADAVHPPAGPQVVAERLYRAGLRRGSAG